jgi:hypothetical protein
MRGSWSLLGISGWGADALGSSLGGVGLLGQGHQGGGGGLALVNSRQHCSSSRDEFIEGVGQRMFFSSEADSVGLGFHGVLIPQGLCFVNYQRRTTMTWPSVVSYHTWNIDQPRRLSHEWKNSEAEAIKKAAIGRLFLNEKRIVSAIISRQKTGKGLKWITLSSLSMTIPPSGCLVISLKRQERLCRNKVSNTIEALKVLEKYRGTLISSRSTRMA